MSNTDTHRRLHDVFNRRDWDALDEYMAEDVTYQDVPRDQRMGSLAEFKQWLGGWAAGFSDGRSRQGCLSGRRDKVRYQRGR